MTETAFCSALVFSESLMTFIKSVFAEVIINNILLKLQSEIRGLYVGSWSKAPAMGAFKILFCIFSELTLCQNDFSRPDTSSAWSYSESEVHAPTRFNKACFIHFQFLLCPHNIINSHCILKQAAFLIIRTLWMLRDPSVSLKLSRSRSTEAISISLGFRHG